MLDISQHLDKFHKFIQKKKKEEEIGRGFILGEIDGRRLVPAVVTRIINLAIGGCSLDNRDGSGNKRIYKYRFFSTDNCLLINQSKSKSIKSNQINQT